MTNRDRVLSTLRAASGPLCDDCVSARSHVSPRQQVYDIATGLALEGVIHRAPGGSCVLCSRTKKVSSLKDTGAIKKLPPSISPISASAEPGSRSGATPEEVDQRSWPSRPWHWEGNVQASLQRFLEVDGWRITNAANTESKAAGVDIAAVKGDRELFVEVKGYPTSTYDHGERRGMPKPTQPTNQARQWFSHALLSVLLLRDKAPSAEVALCFADFPTYRKLLGRTRRSLGILGIGVYLVHADGGVESYLEATALLSP